MKSVKTKTRISVSPKVAVSVVLLVASVAVSGYLLNMAGALTQSGAATSNWEYVLGPDKCSQSSMNNLISSIASGADVKVYLVNNRYQQECSAMEIMRGSSEGKLLVLCYLSGQKIPVLAGPSVVENINSIRVDSSKPCEVSWYDALDRVRGDGVHDISFGDELIMPVKWFVRR